MSITYDNKSPPGSWKNEMSAAPWGYGLTQQQQIERALQNSRRAGLSDEATVISLEIVTLRNELETLRDNKK